MKQNIFLFLLFLILPLNSVNSQWVFSGFAPSNLGISPSVSTPNCSTLVIAGGTTGQPKIYASTNNGPLIDITGNISGAELTCVWAKNWDTIFTGDVGGNAKVWRTFNGGVNWSVVLTTGGSLGYINGIVFERPAQKFGVAFSDPPAVTVFWYAKTRDGGVTWTIHAMTSSGPAGVLNSVFCVDSLLFGFATNVLPPKINYTTNGGISWIIQTLPGISGITTSIAFSNDKLNGIAGSNTITSTIARTTNGGISWFSQSIGGGLSGYCNVKWIWESNTCFVSGSGLSGCIKRSTDAASTWQTMTTGGLSGVVHFDANREPTTTPFGTAIISDGSLIKLTCQPIGISSNNNNIPETFTLEQNYPNPFNPTTKIEFAIPKAGSVNLIVYDVLGKETVVLQDGFLSAGRYSVEFRANEMASGIYFYSLTADGFFDTKRMLIIK